MTLRAGNFLTSVVETKKPPIDGQGRPHAASRWRSVGAIGSALLYILSLARMGGRLTVVDRDEVDTSNLNRSPLFMAINAALLSKKTEVAGKFLLDRGVSVREVYGAWRDVGESLSREMSMCG